ncbi:hypothetical protein NDU88_003024 [Pleurodeles waltl]|uniref:Uncharacterized protein n=1 Tax=Pleurodeles waltl TaxID=8319 RepID=A0AAV7WTG5_PLEWA|nr:hypothetical protein NDU88_003024 [Pleurodeles waltl]
MPRMALPWLPAAYNTTSHCRCCNAVDAMTPRLLLDVTQQPSCTSFAARASSTSPLLAARASSTSPPPRQGNFYSNKQNAPCCSAHTPQHISSDAAYLTYVVIDYPLLSLRNNTLLGIITIRTCVQMPRFFFTYFALNLPSFDRG